LWFFDNQSSVLFSRKEERKKGEWDMEKVKEVSANQCFGQKCPESGRNAESQTPEITPKQRKNADAVLRILRERHHCGFAGLLKLGVNHVRGGRMPLYIFRVLVERVQGQEKRNVLKMDEVYDLREAEAFLKEFKQ